MTYSDYIGALNAMTILELVYFIYNDAIVTWPNIREHYLFDRMKVPCCLYCIFIEQCYLPLTFHVCLNCVYNGAIKKRDSSKCSHISFKACPKKCLLFFWGFFCFVFF